MKKRHANLEVIAEQQKEIDAICVAYDIKHTNVAKEINVAPSTINRFMAGDPPGNTLSSITMKKIRNKFPLPYKKGGNKQLTENELGLLRALECIVYVLLGKKIVAIKDLEGTITGQIHEFQKNTQPNSKKVLSQLLEFLHSGFSEERPPAFQQSQPHLQDQSMKEKF